MGMVVVLLFLIGITIFIIDNYKLKKNINIMRRIVSEQSNTSYEIMINNEKYKKTIELFLGLHSKNMPDVKIYKYNDKLKGYLIKHRLVMRNLDLVYNMYLLRNINIEYIRNMAVVFAKGNDVFFIDNITAEEIDVELFIRLVRNGGK